MIHVLPQTHHGVKVLTYTLHTALIVALLLFFGSCMGEPRTEYENPFERSDWNEYGDGGDVPVAPIESKVAGETSDQDQGI